jgi:hypothetical protein
MHLLAHLNTTLIQSALLAQAAPPEIPAAAAAGIGLAGVLMMVIGLASLALWIIVLIKQFQNDPAWHGIVGIVTCSLYTFIWGWINSTRLNLKKIMLAWTACWVLSLGLNVVFGAAMIGLGAKEAQRQMEAQKAQAPE